MFFALSCATGLRVASVSAQTGPIEESTTLSASVPDHVEPSTPILISPENNSYVTTARPSFVWTQSTDNVAISHYQLWLNGSLLYDAIPTTSTTASNYTLTYDSGTSRYTLSLPLPALNDGTYTWKIRALDAAGNYSDSVTWTFILDTQAPAFVVLVVGEHSTTISVQDPSTIPEGPFVLYDNEPTLSGTGEALSDVVLLVSVPGGPQHTLTFSIDSDGKWSVRLPILPRDTTIPLTFTITDTANHVSILEGVELLLTQLAAQTTPPVLPTGAILLPTPTTTAAATATPSAGSIQKYSGLPPLPAFGVLPKVQLPYTQELTQALQDHLPAEIRQKITRQTNILLPFINLIIALSLPLITIFALLPLFGSDASLHVGRKLYNLVWFGYREEAQGIVTDSISNEPIPLALITVTSTQEGSIYQDQTITDHRGIFRGLDLPDGALRFSVRHERFRYPTSQVQPQEFTVDQHYAGQTLENGLEIPAKSQAVALLATLHIPIDALTTQPRTRDRFRTWLLYTQLESPNTLPTLSALTTFVAILIPTFANWFIAACYLLGIVHRLVTQLTPTWKAAEAKVELTISTISGEPVNFAVLKWDAITHDTDTKRTEKLQLYPFSQYSTFPFCQTDKQGRASLAIVPGMYRVTLLAHGLCRLQPNVADAAQTDSEQVGMAETALVHSHSAMYEANKQTREQYSLYLRDKVPHPSLCIAENHPTRE